MTGELRSLLRRVEAAGGPVEVDGSDDLVFVRLDRRVEMPLWVEDFREDGDHKAENEALLIYALRQDAASRGARAHDYESWPELEPPLYVALVKGMDDASIRGRGRHECEVCAWLLAWLDAFEDTE